MLFHQLKKWGAVLTLAGIVMVSGLALFQLQLAFGWTNPPASPPGGAGGVMVDAVTGNVGVKTASAPDALTVGGAINALGNLIHGVATPVAGTDAVNKDYVLAATSNALTGPIVIYGIGSRPGLIPPDPGNGAIACPNGYSDMLYSASWDINTGQRTGQAVAGGYGPFGLIWPFGSAWGDNDSNGTADFVDDPFTNDPNARSQGAVALTYSLCSAETSHLATFGTTSFGTPLGTPPSVQIVPACATYGGTTQCNTCRICGKDIPVLGP